MPEDGPILLFTVGGAYRPIVDAIKQANPSFVCFFCTDKDVSTGGPGSVRQIVGSGSVILKDGPGGVLQSKIERALDRLRGDDAADPLADLLRSQNIDTASTEPDTDPSELVRQLLTLIKDSRAELERKVVPTLKNVPTQAGLPDNRFAHKLVPADDLDGAVRVMRDAILGLRHRYPHHKMVANYTGGTKTMASALVVCATLEFTDIELQLVTGPRRDLSGVQPGTARTVGASMAAIRLRQAMRPHLDAWQHFAYSEAAAALGQILVRTDTPGQDALHLALGMSRALSSWDSFDHVAARRQLETFRGFARQHWKTHMEAIAVLTDDKNSSQTPARLYDLWLNAQRRAFQRRYDDAVARWYRLVEWTAQWQIERHLGVETKDFPPDLLPSDLAIAPDADGKTKVSLMNAWRILHAKGIERHREFFDQEESALRHHLYRRNSSMLAHGFRSVSERDWDDIQEWTIHRFLPMLKQLAETAGLHQAPIQLPTRPPTLP